VSTWQNVHGIGRIRNCGGAWLKDGFAAPN
jgi:hypothetical protein